MIEGRTNDAASEHRSLQWEKDPVGGYICIFSKLTRP